MTENINSLEISIIIYETNFLFDIFILEFQRLIPGVPVPQSLFLEKVIGIIEGDGCITQNTGDIPTLTISQSTVFAGTLHDINSALGGLGKVNAINEYNHRLQFASKKSLYLIALLLNGNLVFQVRKNRFGSSWLPIVNNYLNSGKTKGMYRNIVFINRNLLPTLLTGWFSGIIGAEGSFYISFNSANQIRIGFSIWQKHIVHYLVIDTISKLLLPTSQAHYYPKTQITEVSINNKIGLKNLEDYLTAHPIIGLKQENFIQFIKVRQIILNKDHLNKDILEYVKSEALKINPLSRRVRVIDQVIKNY